MGTVNCSMFAVNTVCTVNSVHVVRYNPWYKLYHGCGRKLLILCSLFHELMLMDDVGAVTNSSSLRFAEQP
jgi:hypothetical protein